MIDSIAAACSNALQLMWATRLLQASPLATDGSIASLLDRPIALWLNLHRYRGAHG